MPGVWDDDDRLLKDADKTRDEAYLQGLIVVANAGRDAIEEILKKFPGRLQRKFGKKDWHDMNASAGVVYRAKQKEQFLLHLRDAETFIANVTQKNEFKTVVIGCKHFALKDLTEGLEELLKGATDIPISNGYHGQFMANRFGVRYDSYTIEWDEAQKFLNWLKKQ